MYCMVAFFYVSITQSPHRKSISGARFFEHSTFSKALSTFNLDALFTQMANNTMFSRYDQISCTRSIVLLPHLLIGNIHHF